MKEFIEKLTKKLYENVKSKSCPDEACWAHLNKNCDNCDSKEIKVEDVIRIVNQLAEEYKQQLPNDLMIVSSLPSLYSLQDFEEEAIQRVVANANNNGWIPCSERLPEDCTIYEVTAQFGNGMCYTEFAYYDESRGEWWKHDDDGLVNVLAWQPLPAPYQPKGE